MSERPPQSAVSLRSCLLRRVALAGSLLAVTALALPHLDADARPSGSKSWRKANKLVKSAAKIRGKSELQVALARALGVQDKGIREANIDVAKEDFADAREEAAAAASARLELAEVLEETDLYTKEIDKRDFVDGIDHPFLPLEPGNTWTYRVDVGGEVEIVLVEVLNDTKEIEKVDCTIVRETVTVDGELDEIILGWFAQDADGNVWQFGGNLIEFDSDGDAKELEYYWKAGKNGAHPGIVMPAAPTVGHTYRRGFVLGLVEDWARVDSLTADVSVPFDDFSNCIQTFDSTCVEPDTQEAKFYAEGIGLVLEIDLEDDERVELIDTNVK